METKNVKKSAGRNSRGEYLNMYYTLKTHFEKRKKEDERKAYNAFLKSYKQEVKAMNAKDKEYYSSAYVAPTTVL